MAGSPDLDAWLPNPQVRTRHRRRARVDAERLWRVAGTVQVGDAPRLGRVVRWRIPGTRRFSDHGRHPDNELIPGVMIFRPESGLMYFNMDHIRDTIVDRVRVEATVPKLVVLDLSAAPRVDMHSAQMLGSVADELTATGISVQAVEARSSVRERLRGEGVDARLGGINRFTTVADAVEAFQKQTMT